MDRGTQATTRGRGRPARISRERIVETATEIGRERGLDQVTMSAVAERLGVRRTTLNYHLKDHEELLGLVAGAVIEFPWEARWTPTGTDDWRAWVRATARGFRAALRAEPIAVMYFRLTAADEAALAQTDELLGVLQRAGFDERQAAKVLNLIAQIVFICVKDELLSVRTGEHPQDIEFLRALEEMPADHLPHFRAYLANGGHGDPEEQFEFDLECMVAGLEVQLRRRGRRS